MYGAAFVDRATCTFTILPLWAGPRIFTILQLCNAWGIAASTCSFSAVGLHKAPRPLRSRSGRPDNSQLFNFAMFGSRLSPATSTSSSSAAGWCNPVVKPPYGNNRTRRPGCRNHHAPSTFQCFWAGLFLLPRSCSSAVGWHMRNRQTFARPLRSRRGGLNIHNSSTLQSFRAGSCQLPPIRVPRRLHGSRPPNRRRAVVLKDMAA